MSSFTQGNNFLFQKLLQLDRVNYADLATASAVKVKLTQKNATSPTTLEMDLSTNPTQVTIDDPSTGYVSWQLLAADTESLPVAFYTLTIQIEDGSDKYEFVDSEPVQITTQYIS